MFEWNIKNKLNQILYSGKGKTVQTIQRLVVIGTKGETMNKGNAIRH